MTEEKYLPRLCLNCHGGVFKAGQADLQASFLPFDMESFRYPGDCKEPGQANCQQATDASSPELAEKFKQLNAIVWTTQPAKGITDLIHGWYAGDPAQSKVIFQIAHVPDSWKGEPCQTLYRQVIRSSCRTCHIASRRSDFASNYGGFGPSMVDSKVYGEHSMPHTLVTYRHFWRAGSPQPELLQTHMFSMCLERNVTVNAK
jgi:hypothetical protein